MIYLKDKCFGIFLKKALKGKQNPVLCCLRDWSKIMRTQKHKEQICGGQCGVGECGGKDGLGVWN